MSRPDPAQSEHSDLNAPRAFPIPSKRNRFTTHLSSFEGPGLTQKFTREPITNSGKDASSSTGPVAVGLGEGDGVEPGDDREAEGSCSGPSPRRAANATAAPATISTAIAEIAGTTQFGRRRSRCPHRSQNLTPSRLSAWQFGQSDMADSWRFVTGRGTARSPGPT